jgi:hypothetical protein
LEPKPYDEAMRAYTTARKAYDQARGKKRCPGCGGGAFHYHECPSLFRPVYQPPVTSHPPQTATQPQLARTY